MVALDLDPPGPDGSAAAAAALELARQGLELGRAEWQAVDDGYALALAAGHFAGNPYHPVPHRSPVRPAADAVGNWPPAARADAAQAGGVDHA